MNKNKISEKSIENLEKWFGNSHVKNKDQSPKLVYHGTLNDFTIFEREKTNSDNYWGKGFYFSSSSTDVNTNYSHEKGPDYLNRHSRAIEFWEREIEDTGREDIPTTSLGQDITPAEIEDFYNEFPQHLLTKDLSDDEYVKHKALEILGTTHQGIVLPVYLSIQNPFIQEKTKWIFNSGIEITGDVLELFEYLESLTFKKFCSTHLEDTSSGEISLFRNYANDYTQNYLDAHSDFEINEFIKFLVNEISISEDDAEMIKEHLDDKFPSQIGWSHHDVDTPITRLINYFSEDVFSNVYNSVQASDQFNGFVHGYLEKFESFGEDINIDAGPLLKHLQENSYEFFEEDEDGTSFIDHIVNFLKSEGYDGIIMNANEKFKNLLIPSNTTHYICFDSHQIKSALGNNGEYSKENGDILLRVAQKVNKNHEVMSLNDIKSHILEFSEKMDNFVKFRIFNTVEEAHSFLPDDSNKDTKGFYYDNPGREFIGIIRENIENKNDLLVTYVHEAVGHGEIRKLLGDTFKPTMLKLFDFYNRKHQTEFNPQKYTFFSQEQKIKQAEEFLAVSIERKFNSGFSGISLLIGCVLNKVRGIFPELPLTSFDTDYLESCAFKSYQKNNKETINTANNNTKTSLIVNIPSRKPKGSSTERGKTSPT